MIEVQCPACGRMHSAAASEAGQTYACACGNVNRIPPLEPEPASEPQPAPKPSPQPGPAAEPEPGGDRAEVTLYTGRPSQLHNLWLFVGLAVVLIVALWPLRQLLGSMFKTSNWDWYIALTLLFAYAVWLCYRVLLLKCTKYTCTTYNVLIERGILFKSVQNIELFHVSDVRMKRSILQRILGTGDIYLESANQPQLQGVLRSIQDAGAVFQTVSRASAEADAQHGTFYREK